jgi:cell wall-associated NlpC family hydrolase
MYLDRNPLARGSNPLQSIHNVGFCCYRNPDIGALVWFAPNDRNGNAGHVGIYLGNGQFISATDHGVQINDIASWSNIVASYKGWGDAPSGWPGR